jgi:flagellar basal-body rod modification protein FlgD
MTVTPPVSSGSPAANTQLANSQAGSLGKDDFLKLFVAQLTHQDPSSPMDTDQSMQQMAAFSQVEQLTNLASENTKIANTLAMSSAVGLIGKTVTYTDSNQTTHTGAVERVSMSKDGTPSLTVGGTDGVDPSSVTQVA